MRVPPQTSLQSRAEVQIGMHNGLTTLRLIVCARRAYLYRMSGLTYGMSLFALEALATSASNFIPCMCVATGVCGY